MPLRFFVALMLSVFVLFAGGVLFRENTHHANAAPADPWLLTDVTGHLPKLDFQMDDDDGIPITQNALHGDITLMFFGYTSCPDECPATMTRLANILNKIPADHVRVLFVTVAPATDTAQVLHKYLKNFDAAHMIGLTGTSDQIGDLAKRYHAAYDSSAKKDGDIVHSNAIYVFDSNGNARFIVSPMDSDDNLIHDLRKLMQPTGNE